MLAWFKTLGRSQRIIVQSKKKKKKWKKCCFEQVSFGLTNKNIPVKRARLPGFSWFRMSLFCGAGSQPIRTPRLPSSVVWSAPLRPRCQRFSYSCHSLIFISLHGRWQFPHWTKNCGELHSQSNSNGRWLHRVLWGFLFQQKRSSKKKTTNDTNWFWQDGGDEEKEDDLCSHF